MGTRLDIRCSNQRFSCLRLRQARPKEEYTAIDQQPPGPSFTPWPPEPDFEAYATPQRRPLHDWVAGGAHLWPTEDLDLDAPLRQWR